MMIISRFIKILFVAFIVGGFIFSGLVIHFLLRERFSKKKAYVRNISFWCSLALKIFNIKVNFINRPQSKGKAHLLVANHLGYLDMFYMVCAVPTLFVTSVEMRETPILGLVTEMGGCLYVERRSRENIHNEIKEIEEALENGFNVVIYPEGMSTNGEKVLPFKKSLLTAAQNVDPNILPVVMNYRKINGEPMSAKFRDMVCWYGDMTFAKSIWNATQMNSCEVDLEFLEEIPVSPSSDRRVIAEEAQKQIANKFSRII